MSLMDSSVTSGLIAGIRSLGVTLGVAICKADRFPLLLLKTTRPNRMIRYRHIPYQIQQSYAEQGRSGGIAEWFA